MRRARAIAGLLLGLAATGGVLALLPLFQAWEALIWGTLLHLGLAVILVVLVFPFLRSHTRRSHGAIHPGTVNWRLLLFLTGIAISGGVLVVIGQRGRLAALHSAFGIGFVVLLVRHAFRGKIRRALGSPVLAGGLVIVVALVLGTTFASRSDRKSDATTTQFAPARMRVRGALPPYDQTTMAPAQCASCHADIVRQWQQSIHAVADTELIYARVVGDFRQRYGLAASNWCAGCHSPLRLARDELNVKVADVPQPNVNCLSCHSIQQIHEPIGNNGFDLEVRSPFGYDVGQSLGLPDQLLLMQPSAHRARWNPSIIRTPEFCGTCHRQILPAELAGGRGGLVLQDTYGEWQASQYNSSNPLVRRICQDCHMPSAPGVANDLGNNRPSHFFVGGSRDVARINGSRELYAEQQRLLASAATLSIDGLRCDRQALTLRLSVANTGVGHNLPTGVTDLRQIWLEVTVNDSAGAQLYQSGTLDQQGALDPAAVRFGVVLGDEHGQPVNFHDIARARQILSDTTIPAGATREVQYPLPSSKSAQLHVEAKLLYQSVPQNFIDHFISSYLRFERTTMASAVTTLDVPSPCGS